MIQLDVMLSHKDGHEICREICHRGLKTPVILLTAKTHEAEKVVWLNTGADDYVTARARRSRARYHRVQVG
jgi:DNA-binding response OmpR family regulator